MMLAVNKVKIIVLEWISMRSDKAKLWCAALDNMRLRKLKCVKKEVWQMRKLLTPRQMRDTEKAYMEQTLTPSSQLMERAARTLCDTIIELYGSERTI